MYVLLTDVLLAKKKRIKKNNKEKKFDKPEQTQAIEVHMLSSLNIGLSHSFVCFLYSLPAFT